MLLCEGLRVLSLVWRAPFRCGYRHALRLFLQPARAHALLLCRELRALPAQPALFSLRCGALARDEPLPFSQLDGGLVLPPSSSCCEGASACRTWHTCASASFSLPHAGGC
jgi:hypothetical protein